MESVSLLLGKSPHTKTTNKAPWKMLKNFVLKAVPCPRSTRRKEGLGAGGVTALHGLPLPSSAGFPLQEVPVPQPQPEPSF